MARARRPGRASGFADRREAGWALGRALMGILPDAGNTADRTDLVVLGLPRGGVPVAREVADALHARLDVFVVRKLGVPGHSELAFGAIAHGGVQVLNADVVAAHHVTDADIARIAEAEAGELNRREELYRGNRPFPPLSDATVIVVDDGLATGATMRAAAIAVRRLGAAFVVCAVPVGPAATPTVLGDVADLVECLLTPERFMAVGEFYSDFSQTTDAQVREALAAY